MDDARALGRNLRIKSRDFARVDELLCQQWSPEQVSGHLRRSEQTRHQPRDHLSPHLER